MLRSNPASNLNSCLKFHLNGCYTQCEVLALYCGSAVAYMDVGEGREQDAEASPARFAAGRRSHSRIPY